MAKIWKGHRGESTRGEYNIECLEDEAKFEREQLKTSAATGLSSSFKSVSLFEPHPASQIDEDEESDQPLDLSSSKSKIASLNSQAEEDGGGGERSDERDSNSTYSSSSQESPVSERSFSPEVQESPRRGPRLSKDEKWMINQGVSDHISIADVIKMEHPELKQTLAGLVSAGNLTELQASELMHIRKRGRNKITAKKSRKKKDDEIVHLKKAVRDAERNQKPVAEEQRDLLLEYAYLEQKLANLTHYLLSWHQMNPDEYQVVVEGEDVQFVRKD